MSKKNIKLYHVTFAKGLHRDMDIEAANEHEAAVAALSEYRRNYGFVETVHEWPLEKVVVSVELK